MKQVGSPIMRRVLEARSMTPAQAALAGRMKNYNGRTCGIVSTYNAGCRCADCTEAKRLDGVRRRRKSGAKPRNA